VDSTVDEVLLEGIEDNDQGRQLANERLKGLHPFRGGETAIREILRSG